MSLLQVENLNTTFQTDRGGVQAVNNISFEIDAKEHIGLVGESGAGKSVTGLSILGLVEGTGNIEGTIRWKGEDLRSMSDHKLNEIRGNEISWIPQNPLSGLNPTSSIGEQIKETLRTHNHVPKSKLHDRTIELLSDVGIPSPEERIDDYPHQYSGGMRQRVLIAIALCCDPDLIIADEPTTALDVLTQAQLVQLLNRINRNYGTSLLLITHDLGLVAEICERVMIMYAGKIVEKSSTLDVFDDPLHPYTQELLLCNPSMSSGDRLNAINGSMPDGVAIPDGCSFHPRCPKAFSDCSKVEPDLIEEKNDREVSCLLYDPDL